MRVFYPGLAGYRISRRMQVHDQTYLCLLIWQRALPLPTKAGWYAVLEDPQMPAMSTVLDQAYNAMDRKLFAMKGFHHPGGSQAAFLTGLAHLYNLIPSPSPACRQMWGGSRRWSRADFRLDTQLADPHLGWLPICA